MTCRSFDSATCVRREFERNPAVLAEADPPDAAMMACEAVRLLEKDNDAFVSANEVPHSSETCIPPRDPGPANHSRA